MKKLAAALGVALAVSVGANAYQELPSGAPSKPIYVQRVVQLLEASNNGDWKGACDAAPTAAYSLNDYYGIALGEGITNIKQLGDLCLAVLKSSLTKDGKTPVGLDWQVLYWSPEGQPGEKLVIARLKWHTGVPASTVVFHVAKWRLEWDAKKVARCGPKKVACPALRWYILGAT